MSKILAAEYAVSIAFNSWGAIKAQQVPWPGTIMRVTLAFGVLSVVAMADERIADLLGAGFMLASLLNTSSKSGNAGLWTKQFGAIPPANGPNFPYFTLQWAKPTAAAK